MNQIIMNESPDSQNIFFNKALHDFTFEVAVGGEIRHLMKLGYSEDEILKRLDYPISRDMLHEAMAKYEKKADSDSEYEIIREFDSYGRLSFRKVRKRPEDNPE